MSTPPTPHSNRKRKASNDSLIDDYGPTIQRNRTTSSAATLTDAAIVESNFVRIETQSTHNGICSVAQHPLVPTVNSTPLHSTPSTVHPTAASAVEVKERIFIDYNTGLLKANNVLYHLTKISTDKTLLRCNFQEVDFGSYDLSGKRTEKVCEREFKLKKGSNIPHQIANHYKTFHRISKEVLMKAALKAKYRKNQSPTQRTFNAIPKKSKEEELREAIVRDLVITNRSLNSLSRDSFRDIIKQLNITKLSPTSAMVDIKDMVLNLQAKIIHYIKETKTPISLTSDETSISGISFMVVNIHFLLSEFHDVVSLPLGLIKLNNQRSFNLAERLKTLVERFNLQDQVIGITTDNATNVLAMKQCIVESKFFKNLLPDLNIGCLCHVFNLAMASYLKDKGHISEEVPNNLLLEEQRNRSAVLRLAETQKLLIDGTISVDDLRVLNEELLQEDEDRNGVFSLRNLLSTKSFDPMDLVTRITKCRTIITRSTTLRAEYDMLKQEQSGSGSLFPDLKSFVPTRWNSCIQCLESMVRNKPILNELSIKNKIFYFTEEEYKECEVIADKLRTFDNFTHLMSGVNATLLLVLPLLSELIRKVHQLAAKSRSMSDQQETSRLDSSIKKLQKYKEVYSKNPLVLLASQMLPSALVEKFTTRNIFKLSLKQESIIEEYLLNLVPEKKLDGPDTVLYDIIRKLRNKLEEINLGALEDDPYISFEEYLRKSVIHNGTQSEKDAAKWYLKAQATEESASTELKRFLLFLESSTKFQSITRLTEINKFFGTRKETLKSQFPVIHRLIFPILVAQGSSVSSERSFSELKKLLTSERKTSLLRSDSGNLEFLLLGKSLFSFQIRHKDFFRKLDKIHASCDSIDSVIMID